MIGRIGTTYNSGQQSPTSTCMCLVMEFWFRLTRETQKINCIKPNTGGSTNKPTETRDCQHRHPIINNNELN